MFVRAKVRPSLDERAKQTISSSLEITTRMFICECDRDSN